MDNYAVAKILDEVGDLLEVQGEAPFRVRAYHKAADSIRGLGEDINKVSDEARLETIQAIGKSLASHITELLETGKMEFFEDLKGSMPPEAMGLLRVPGLGPRRARQLYKELNVKTIEDLRSALNAQRLRDLRGMSARTEVNLRKGLDELDRVRDRILLYEGWPVAQGILEQLRRDACVARAEMVGSLRRMQETIGGIDILVATDSSESVISLFCRLPQVEEISKREDKRAVIVVQPGLGVDLRVVRPNEFGSALQYFTGSTCHNSRLRQLAQAKGLVRDGHKVARVTTGESIDFVDEGDIYAALGMDHVPAPLREDRGEIEAGQSDSLPRLIRLDDVRGDLHVHSRWSDGLSSVRQIGIEACEQGLEYVCISDHAVNLRIAGGLTVDELRQRDEEIARVNAELGGAVTVLSGIELNIDNEGLVDYPNDFLARFDVVTASVHGGFGQATDQLTKRVIKAVENPAVDIIAHPTGRLIGRRPAYNIDMEAVISAAAATGTVLELNAFPDRLDLNDLYLRKAKERRVRISIATDAHHRSHLRYMFYGIATAQRGWLE
ncbi:MAG: DNA polymerase/3'-5' exonuclease PolX, partial [Terriglobia bacterium]